MTLCEGQGMEELMISIEKAILQTETTCQICLPIKIIYINKILPLRNTACLAIQ
jgi:hypothetical protein